MKLLFVHQNFPGQYLPLVLRLARDPHNEIVFLTQRRNVTLPGVRVVHYSPARPGSRNSHPYLRRAEELLLNGQRVAAVAERLKKAGFVPDAMLGHAGWGETLFLKDVFPNSAMIGFFEFFYRAAGADVGFGSEQPPDLPLASSVRSKNLINLLALDAADAGQTPTRWQHSVHPPEYHQKIRILHEGIDSQVARPNAAAEFILPGSGRRLSRKDEVVTYVARNLEPYRGFPQFMRSLPALLAQRPHAEVLVIGGDDTSYGPPPAAGGTWRQLMLQELGPRPELARVHFLGKLPHASYLRVLQISSVHLYLTVPFVLSWSMLEAMACGCVLVGSRTAPVEEVLRDGHNGLLVDFHDPAAIASTLANVLARRDAFEPLRLAARATIEARYDAANIGVPAQIALIREVANL